MLRKIGFTLLCAAATFSPSAFSITTNALTAGITLEYDLLPNEAQIFINPMFWAIEAECKISTEDSSDELRAEVLAKKGKINGITLDKGGVINLVVHAGDKLKIGADSGAKVQIINLGEHTVKATCVA